MQVTIEHDGHTITADTLKEAEKEIRRLKRETEKATKKRAADAECARARADKALAQIADYLDVRIAGKDRRGWSFCDGMSNNDWCRDHYGRMIQDEGGARLETEEGYFTLETTPATIITNGAGWAVAIRLCGPEGDWYAIGHYGESHVTRRIPDFMASYLQSYRNESNYAAKEEEAAA